MGTTTKRQRISVPFHGKPFNIAEIQVCAPTTDAKDGEVDLFYEYLQDLLELTPEKDVLFTIRDYNEKVGSQEIPGVTDNFGIGVQNEAGQRQTEFCQENMLVTANIFATIHEMTLHMDLSKWSIP